MATMQLMPVEIIQRQVCSECSLYLTVLPITQLKNGQILCGRNYCRNKNGTKSLLSTLMESFQFNCINYLDGCKELLTSATSKNHEKTCNFFPRDCFFCSYKGNWAQILRHMKTDHPLNITEECRFRFETGEESSQKFIYVADDNTCVVSVRTSSQKLTVIISMVNSSSNIKINQITFKFCKYPYFKNQDILVDNFAFNSRSKNCIEKSTEELVLCFNLGSVLTCEIIFDSCDLSDKEIELEKKGAWLKGLIHDLSNQQKSLNDQNLELVKQKGHQEAMSNVLRQIISIIYWCQVCKNSICGDVYTCENKHFHCQNCVEKQIGNEVCLDLQKIEWLSKIYVTCEWTECRKLVSVANYLDHKSRCSQRMYKCPVIFCPVNIFSLKALEDHWHLATKLINTDSLVIDKFGTYKWFWIINDDLYKVYVKFQNGSVMVDIESVSVVHNNKFTVQGNCPSFGQEYRTTWCNPNTTTLYGKYIFSASYLGSVNVCPHKIKITLL